MGNENQTDIEWVFNPDGSRPAYRIFCLGCGESWQVAEYDVIDFLIREYAE